LWWWFFSRRLTRAPTNALLIYHPLISSALVGRRHRQPLAIHPTTNHPEKALERLSVDSWRSHSRDRPRDRPIQRLFERTVERPSRAAWRFGLYLVCWRFHISATLLPHSPHFARALCHGRHQEMVLRPMVKRILETPDFWSAIRFQPMAGGSLRRIRPPQGPGHVTRMQECRGSGCSYFGDVDLPLRASVAGSWLACPGSSIEEPSVNQARGGCRRYRP
jgi:hypothetical protein